MCKSFVFAPESTATDHAVCMSQHSEQRKDLVKNTCQVLRNSLFIFVSYSFKTFFKKIEVKLLNILRDLRLKSHTLLSRFLF